VRIPPLRPRTAAFRARRQSAQERELSNGAVNEEIRDGLRGVGGEMKSVGSRSGTGTASDRALRARVDDHERRLTAIEKQT
jgi:hypothetical protein